MSSRNALCSCGSGKKFKKCCLMVKADENGIDVGEGKRRLPLRPAREIHATRLKKVAVVALTFVLLLILLCSTSHASGWYWLPAGNGYYVRASATGNDGYYYTLSYGSYVRAQQITVVPPVDWKAKLVGALEKQRENDYFLQALRESGLTPDFQQQATATAAQNSYSTSTVVTQQGVGYHGLQAYAPNIGSVDIEALMARNARIVERMVDGTLQADALLKDRTGDIAAGQIEVAKINAAGAALVASIQATQQPRTTTQQTTQFQGIGPNGGAVYEGVEGPAPPTIRPLGTSKTIELVRAEALLNQKCGKCHVSDSKGGFVLERLDANTFDRVWGAVHSQKKPMPPANSGIAPLNAREILTLSKAAP